jgi:crossover junction endodeoxyribonuclease RusA
MKLQFVVPGPPVPKERARVVRRKNPLPGQRATTSFTPDKTAQYEAHVKLHALAARCKTHRWPWQDTTAPFYVGIKIYRSQRRGDWDNFAKAITDACNGVLWHDDRQIVHATVAVRSCDKGHERAEVEVGTSGSDNAACVAIYGGLTK